VTTLNCGAIKVCTAAWKSCARVATSTAIRLTRAKHMLSLEREAAQTANDVGFFDQSHFIKKFRAHFGITPGAFAAASLQ